jgi:hypothetical protein
MDESKISEILESLEVILNSAKEPEKKLEELNELFHSSVTLSTSNEGTNFRNFYARYRYILEKTSLNNHDKANIEAFRRFSIKKPRVIDSATQVFHQAAHVVIKLVESLWDKFKGKVSTQALQPYISSFFPSVVPTRDYSKLKDLRILCVGKPQPSPSPETHFKIKGYDLENMLGLIEINIDRHTYTDFSYLFDLQLDSSIVQFKRLSQVSSEPLVYRTNFDSLIVVEPDYLLDATSIGDCFQEAGENFQIYFLRMLLNDLPGIPALKGSMIGNYLDNMILREGELTDELFNKAQRTNAIQAARFGSAEMTGIKLSIEREHLPNIRRLVNRYERNNPWIEPTYFSSEYGLQGRIDLLMMGKGETNKPEHVLELKSGRASNPTQINAWRGHAIQVVCYAMLLESTYQTNYTVSSSLYYSQCQIIPERNITAEHKEKQSVLKIRNQIVSSIIRLSLNDFSTLERIKDQGIVHLPSFSESQLGKFQEHYRPNTTTIVYYQELLAFILRELIFAKIGSANGQRDERQPGLSSIWLDPPFKKKKRYSILLPLTLTQIDKHKGALAFSFPESSEHSFRKGDLVIVYPASNEDLNPLSNHILKGSINELSKNSIEISLNNKQTNYSFIKSFQTWAIERDIFETNYLKTISCLFNFVSSPERKRRLILGVEVPLFEQRHRPEDQILVHQGNCLNKALDAKDYFILQGPPGTGKTSTFLVKYISTALQEINTGIIVLAFTNKAVDKICESFRKPRSGSPINYIRLGGRHTQDPQLFEDLLMENDPDSWRQMLQRNRVLVSTVAKFQNNLLVLKTLINFKQVVIDEASQLTEADLAGILALFEKFILIGDHKQLPAVVTQDESDCCIVNKYLERFKISDLRTSLFERLLLNAKDQKWENAYAQLTDHHRMHEEIAALVQQAYPQKLKASKDEQRSSTLPIRFNKSGCFHQLNESRTIFIETPRQSGNVNAYEAKIAADIVSELITFGGLLPTEIGIITPSKAQIFEIKRCLPADSEILVDTVERFQGDERKIIIFSSTINSRSQLRTIESISKADDKKTDRKLLVTVSRAMEQIIILGDLGILKASQSYADLIQQLKIVSLSALQIGDFQL